MKLKLIILSLIGIFNLCSCENQEIDIFSKDVPPAPPVPGPMVSFLDSICKNASKDNPVDITKYVITCASYDKNDYDGWNGTKPLHVRSGCLEYWNMNFDANQSIDSLPEGNYLLTVQGFYRRGNCYGDIESYLENDSTQDNALLYAQSSEENVSVPFIFTSTHATRVPKQINDSFIDMESEGLSEEWQMYLPNTMEAASVAFDKGQYVNKLAVSVGKDGKLKIGFKKNALIDSDWCIVDNWHLVCYGKDKPSVVTINTLEAIYDYDGIFCSGYFSKCEEADEVGFLYGYVPDLNLSNSKKIKGWNTKNNIYAKIVETLDRGKETLYCRTYAKINGEYFYGDVVSTFINYPSYMSDFYVDFACDTKESVCSSMENFFDNVETDVQMRNLPFWITTSNCIRASDDDVEWIVVCSGENILQKYMYFHSKAVNKSELEKWIVGTDCGFISSRYLWTRDNSIIYTNYDVVISSGYDEERKMPYIFIQPYDAVNW